MLIASTLTAGQGTSRVKWFSNVRAASVADTRSDTTTIVVVIGVEIIIILAMITMLAPRQAKSNQVVSVGQRTSRRIANN